MFLRRRLLLVSLLLAIVVLYRRLTTDSRGTRARRPITSNKIYHLNITQPRHPIARLVSLPEGNARSIPPIQADFAAAKETSHDRKVRLQRQDAVKDAFMHAWNGYKFHAFSKDEVRPISGGWRDSFGGWGATMVDSMDMLWLLGLKGDFDMCVDVVSKIDFTTNTEDSLNVFEANIRYLGGLLAAYDISGGTYATLLQKAKELGDILYLAFDTPNRMPVTRWEWKLTAEGLPLDQTSAILLAELASMSLEFTRLSQLTHDPKYYDAIHRISSQLHQIQNSTKVPGLWPTMVRTDTLDFSYNHFTFGGMVDSAYEYLPKQFLLLGGLVPMYQDMYEAAIEVAKKYLFYRPMIPTNENVLFSGNAAMEQTGEVATETQAQHLSCFIGGMVAMASKVFALPGDMQVARRLVDGCIWAYGATSSKLMPEVFHLSSCYIGSQSDSMQSQEEAECTWSDEKWYKAVTLEQVHNDETVRMSDVEAGKYWVRLKSIQKGFTSHPDNRYILRPEAIESIFVLYRATGDVSLMEKAWTMFQTIETLTRTQIAYAEIYDVRAASDDVVKGDRMESFFLAETLKYFWLIFAEPDTVSLDDWVLNTEAHMFKRPKAGQPLG